VDPVLSKEANLTRRTLCHKSPQFFDFIRRSMSQHVATHFSSIFESLMSDETCAEARGKVYLEHYTHTTSSGNIAQFADGNQFGKGLIGCFFG
jgi:hypothetical protein